MTAAVGTLVWHQTEGFPMWPARVWRASNVPQRVRKVVEGSRVEGHVLIAYLGADPDEEFCWVLPESLRIHDAQSLELFRSGLNSHAGLWALECLEKEVAYGSSMGAQYCAGALVWARVAAPGTWWPGRVWKIQHTSREHRRALERDRAHMSKKSARVVSLLGEGTFNWFPAEDLKPFEGDHCAEFTSKMGENAQALTEAAAPFRAPWGESDSDTDESRGGSPIRLSRSPRTPKAPRAPRSAAQERNGLTPDWVVDAGCAIFGLHNEGTIKGLLDPCCNDKEKPNIPAERLYDKRDDGLLKKNEWKGFHVILNPPYEPQTQWRFINRAINEVEFGNVPGALIVCRNSTDTGYFQRLRPYLRVMLRRDAIRFKDYASGPIGFGICVFVLAKAPEHRALYYPRFVEQFASKGDINTVVDLEFVQSMQFQSLTNRLDATASDELRDKWIKCDACGVWREQPAGVDEDEAWNCGLSLRGGCASPLTNKERRAFSYKKEDETLPHRKRAYAPAFLNEYELEREERIRVNRARMLELITSAS